MSIKIICPSRDRTCQLDCLLRSIEQNWTFDGLEIGIIYKATNDRFAEGYDRVFDSYWFDEYDIWACPEGDFCEDIKTALHPLDEEEHSLAGFMCDDCVVYRSFGLSSEDIVGAVNKDVVCFSMRLSDTHYIQNYQILEIHKEIKGLKYFYNHHDLIEWKYKTYPRYSNPGYLFSMDGHFYPTGWLYGAVKDRTFESPRALEHQLNVDDSLRSKAPANMVCSADGSAVFVNTINAIQEGIPAGLKYSYSPEELNQKFLKGERISMRSFDNIEIFGCHDEIKLEFEPYE